MRCMYEPLWTVSCIPAPPVGTKKERERYPALGQRRVPSPTRDEQPLTNTTHRHATTKGHKVLGRTGREGEG
jgi:hypothetical protein